MLQGGVDVSQVRWVRSDGAGRHVRNGLNFTERGFGVRGALGVSDRGHTAASQLRPGDVDWEQILGTAGARWFHTGGIFAALSASTPDVAEEAMRAAGRHGAVVSYDLNYRPSLWADYGGQDRAQEVNRSLVRHADVLFGNEEDFTAALGFDVPATAADFADLQAGNFQKMIASVTREFGQLRVVATTLRTATTASVNDWGAIAWADGRFYQATYRPGLAILDRVGGGDSFASGLIFGLMETGDPAMAVEYGAAHGALSMTTPGDTSMATRAEVAALVRGAGARVQRWPARPRHRPAALPRGHRRRHLGGQGGAGRAGRPGIRPVTGAAPGRRRGRAGQPGLAGRDARRAGPASGPGTGAGVLGRADRADAGHGARRRGRAPDRAGAHLAALGGHRRGRRARSPVR